MDAFVLPSQFERAVALARMYALDGAAPLGAVFIGAAAALLHGYDLPPGHLEDLNIVIPGGKSHCTTSLPEIRGRKGTTVPARVHRRRHFIPDAHIGVIDGLLVTSPFATAVTAILTESPCTALVVTGQALRAAVGYTQAAPTDAQRQRELDIKQQWIESVRGEPKWWRHVERIAQFIELAQGANTDIAEFLMHYILMAGGFETVYVQPKLTIGGQRYVPDFHIEEWDVFVEIDGRDKYEAFHEAGVLPDDDRELNAAIRAAQFDRAVQWETTAGETRTCHPDDFARIEASGRLDPGWRQKKRIHETYARQLARDRAFRGAGRRIEHFLWDDLRHPERIFGVIGAAAETQLLLRPREILLPFPWAPPALASS